MDKLKLSLPLLKQSIDTRTHAKFNIRNSFDTNYKESLNVINEYLLTIYNALRASLFHRAESMMIELLAAFQTYQENISSFHSYIKSSHYEPFFFELALELSKQTSQITKTINTNLCLLINEFNRYTFPLEHHAFCKKKLKLFHTLLKTHTILAQDSFNELLSKIT